MNINKLHMLALDITMDCHLSCFNCNRFCDILPEKRDDMSIKQVAFFLEESTTLKYKWRRIRVSGGEPTESENFTTIINMLLDYQKTSPNTIIAVVTNGVNKTKTRQFVGKIELLDTEKRGRTRDFFFISSIAPVDLCLYKNDKKIALQEENFVGCVGTNEDYQHCSLCLNSYGFYPSSQCGAIDRVFGFDIGIKSLRNVSIKNLEATYKKLCPYCGIFLGIKSVYPKTLMSDTWHKAVQNYHLNKPFLVKYGS